MGTVGPPPAKWPARAAYDADSPTGILLDRIADKWTALVVYALVHGPKRHGELRRTIEGISQKMLTQTLKNLEADGLVTRTVFPTVPVTVEYALTPLGESLAPALDALRRWAEENIEAVLAARAKHRGA